MEKVAIVILAGPGSKSALGRLVNALEAAREFVEADDEVEVIFDGAGTQWVPVLDDPDHDYHHLYAAVRDSVSVCEYCADTFEVADAIAEAERVALLSEFEGHPSIRSLVADDYEIITY